MSRCCLVVSLNLLLRFPSVGVGWRRGILFWERELVMMCRWCFRGRCLDSWMLLVSFLLSMLRMRVGLLRWLLLRMVILWLSLLVWECRCNYVMVWMLLRCFWDALSLSLWIFSLVIRLLGCLILLVRGGLVVMAVLPIVLRVCLGLISLLSCECGC